ncbi:hypothetical protein ABZ446_34215 [Streptomyces sp. NPDC005813]|uniref:hypothetical protein n=1 Tax=Streptomyces sp. NPDC005813 TaxID=3155592 RepID=UPI00340E2669
MEVRTVRWLVAVPAPATPIDPERANPPAGTDVQQVLAIVVREHHTELSLVLTYLSLTQNRRENGTAFDLCRA